MDIHDHAEEFNLLYQEKDVGDIRVGMLYNAQHVYTFYGLCEECEALMRGIITQCWDDDCYDLIEYPNCDVYIFIETCEWYTETRINVLTGGEIYTCYMFTDKQGNVLQLKRNSLT